MAAVMHAHVPGVVVAAVVVTQGLWWGEGEGQEYGVGVVLGKFGFKLIQTRFEPKPNQQFRVWFGDSCHETKPFGFSLGNQ